MRPSQRIADVEAVSRFFAERKTLFESPPEFGLKRTDQRNSPWEARWPIVDSAGSSTGGAHLRITLSPASDRPLSISVIFLKNCIYRIDFVAHSICHHNPHWAAALGGGITPMVCGPHVHPWEENRRHVETQDEWQLPCRIALPPQIQRFDQAFPWLADRVNIILEPRHRSFELPRDLF